MENYDMGVNRRGRRPLGVPIVDWGGGVFRESFKRKQKIFRSDSSGFLSRD